MNERKLAAAIYRLSNPNYAKADLDLLAKLKPEIVKSPDFRTLSFSPRHNHALILKKLLDVTTEQAIEDNRRPAEDGEKATVPGSSAAGQNKEVPTAGQNKKKSPKKTSTRTSTGKTSSTATSKKQS